VWERRPAARLTSAFDRSARSTHCRYRHSAPCHRRHLIAAGHRDRANRGWPSGVPALALTLTLTLANTLRLTLTLANTLRLTLALALPLPLPLILTILPPARPAFSAGASAARGCFDRSSSGR